MNPEASQFLISKYIIRFHNQNSMLLPYKLGWIEQDKSLKLNTSTFIISFLTKVPRVYKREKTVFLTSCIKKTLCPHEEELSGIFIVHHTYKSSQSGLDINTRKKKTSRQIEGRIWGGCWVAMHMVPRTHAEKAWQSCACLWSQW